MRKPTGRLSNEDALHYAEVAITRDRSSSELKLTMRKLQAQYRYGVNGGIDSEDGTVVMAGGKRTETRLDAEELKKLNAQHEAAEIADLEWGTLLLQLREKYNAPMSAMPNDDGDWIVPGRGAITSEDGVVELPKRSGAPLTPVPPELPKRAGAGRRK
jgi:hypothetical protein